MLYKPVTDALMHTMLLIFGPIPFPDYCCFLTIFLGMTIKAIDCTRVTDAMNHKVSYLFCLMTCCVDL